MADGTYCDIYTGDVIQGECTGRIVTVSGGNVNVNLAANAEDACIAIHTQVILSNNILN